MLRAQNLAAADNAEAETDVVTAIDDKSPEKPRNRLPSDGSAPGDGEGTCPSRLSVQALTH